MQRSLAFGALALVAILAGFSSFHFITPEEMTATAIAETFHRIHLFAVAHTALPKTLDQLPKRQNYANRVTDGWGRTLILEVDDNGVITLRSLGKDGKVGGDGVDRDIARRHRTRDEDGRFTAADDMWIVTSEL